jgi:hypothetical protein
LLSIFWRQLLRSVGLPTFELYDWLVRLWRKASRELEY